jgi:phosphoribosylglycinamide formyltransferase 1
MKKIVFLVSGGGANLKFIYYSLKLLSVDAEITGVISDRKVDLEEFVKEQKIYFKQISYNRNHNKELLSELKYLNPDLIITNIHKIIDRVTLESYSGKLINLHYSLLPAFGGLIGMKPIQEARNQNVRFIGGTCHEVNEIVDSGKILFQGCFAVDWNLDDKILADTIFKLSCLLLLSGILAKLNLFNGSISISEINDFKINYSPPLPLKSTNFTFDVFNKLS